VVPYSAGGDADLSARNLSAGVRNVTGDTLLVLNKAGAGGAIGSQFSCWPARCMCRSA